MLSERMGAQGWSSLSVYLSAVPHGEHSDCIRTVINRVEDAIVANADAVAISVARTLRRKFNLRRRWLSVAKILSLCISGRKG